MFKRDGEKNRMAKILSSQENKCYYRLPLREGRLFSICINAYFVMSFAGRIRSTITVSSSIWKI